MVFRWFTSIPSFIAEQLDYLTDPTDLIKLKMFKNRVNEKILEFESRSSTAETDHGIAEEDLSRISEQVNTLSKLVKNVKERFSPKKGDGSAGPANNLRVDDIDWTDELFFTQKPRDESAFSKAADLSDELFESQPPCDVPRSKTNVSFYEKNASSRILDSIPDNRSGYDNSKNRDAPRRINDPDSDDEATNKPETFKKPTPINLRKNAKISGLVLQKTASAYDNLPSTQEIDKVFANWRDSKNRSGESSDDSRETRKRNVTPKSSVKPSTTKKAPVSRNFDDSDDDFDYSSVPLPSPAVQNNSSCSVIEPTAYSAPKTTVKGNTRSSGCTTKPTLDSFQKSASVSSESDDSISVVEQTAMPGRVNSRPRLGIVAGQSIKEPAGDDFDSRVVTRVANTVPFADSNTSSKCVTHVSNTALNSSEDTRRRSSVLGDDTKNSNCSYAGGMSDSFDKSVSTVASTPAAGSKFKLKIPILAKNLTMTSTLFGITSPTSNANSSSPAPPAAPNRDFGDGFSDLQNPTTTAKTAPSREAYAEKTSSSEQDVLSDLIDTEVLDEFASLDDELDPEPSNHDFRSVTSTASRSDVDFNRSNRSD